MDLTKLNVPLRDLSRQVQDSLIKAQREGETIQVYNRLNLKWFDVPWPVWADSSIYRVKPSDKPETPPKIPNEGFVEVTYLDGEMVSLVWTKTAT